MKRLSIDEGRKLGLFAQTYGTRILMRLFLAESSP